jgi:hypothetical protein
MRRNAPVVDDPPSAVRLHELDSFLGTQKRSREVRKDYVLPHVERDVFQLDVARGSGAGVVEEEVAAAPFGFHSCEERFDLKEVKEDFSS